MNLVTVISTKVEGFKRKIKFLRLGKSDIQETAEVSPFGIDSNPVKDLIAVYAPTLQQGKAVIIGYINKNQLADVGETRLFSTDAQGDLQTFIHLKNDGTIEMGGAADFMVRYTQMAASVNELKNDLTNLKAAFTGWVPVPTDGGLALKVTSATWFGTPLVQDISNAKIAEIKTP